MTTRKADHRRWSRGLRELARWVSNFAGLSLVNLRKGTAAPGGKRRQTLCDKRDNNSVWKQFPPNFTFLLKDQDPNTVILIEHHKKHAGNRPVTFVTRKRFALLRKLTFMGWGPGISLCYCLLRACPSATTTGNKRKYNQKCFLAFQFPA